MEPDDIVEVVEVNTFEKLAKPFIRLGLLRKGEVRPKLPRLSGLYRADIGKLGFEYRNGSAEEPSMLAAAAA